MPSLSSILRGLNPQQHAAVTSEHRVTLVLAGAGSGKTRVIASRVAWHLARGGDPAQVSAVTFTNKAAREMAARIGRKGDGPQPFIGTFHRFGLAVLRKHGRRLGVGPRPTIVDRGDQLGVLRESLRELRLRPGAWNLGEALDLLLDGRTQHALTGRVNFQRAHGLTPVGRDLVRIYEERLRALGAVDFDDLLLLPLRLLRQHPDAAASVRERARFLLVDEFQDTNLAQLELVCALCGDDGTLTVVGDDDQSIYAFRGARVENILEFHTRFEGAETVRLEENYRSVRPVLALANRVIAENTDRNEKVLRVNRQERGSVRLFAASSPEVEADMVRKEIERALGAGVSEAAIAVLYRANRQAGPIEEALTAARLPYRRVGGTSLLERKEVRDALAWLGILLDRGDDPAFRRAVQSPPRGVGPASLRTIEAAAERGRSSLMEAAFGLLSHADSGLPDSARRGLKAMRHAVDAARATMRSSGAVDAWQQVLGRVEFRAHLLASADTPAEGSRRFGRVMALGRVLGKYLERDPASGAQDFLESILLDPGDHDDDDDGAGKITLMTLHGSKGLEFDLVFLIGVEEGICPHERSLADAAGLAEERRLLYVGITRARLHLVLSYARRRDQGGPVGDERLTRFLRGVGLTPRLLAGDTDLRPERRKDSTATAAISRLRAALEDDD